MNKGDGIAAVIFIAFLVMLLVLLGGCSWHNSNKLSCKTETNVKRTCDSEGTGKEIIILPGAPKR